MVKRLREWTKALKICTIKKRPKIFGRFLLPYLENYILLGTIYFGQCIFYIKF
ncbi:hypothetical protein FLACHUCJ7_01395 [Flavobacterium chungangense]|uniref:Uncharacterized protein n=1 Tax=Flavobacterium chungangense TaxID=554283 RepID=A0A6V6YVQ6_9FLAO|nr:hypothetical protein FLACHUCJ7_01395 [Flavobacterium chungangense]